MKVKQYAGPTFPVFFLSASKYAAQAALYLSVEQHGRLAALDSSKRSMGAIENLMRPNVVHEWVKWGQMGDKCGSNVGRMWRVLRITSLHTYSSSQVRNLTACLRQSVRHVLIAWSLPKRLARKQWCTA